MTDKERKAARLGLDLNDCKIRLLYYLWAACNGSGFCNVMHSGVCQDRRILVAAAELMCDGYIEEDADDGCMFRLTGRGRGLIYSLQAL